MSNSLSLFIPQSTPTGKLICCSPTVECIHTRPLQQTTAIHGHEKASQPEPAGSPYVSAQRASPRLTSSLFIRIVYKTSEPKYSVHVWMNSLVSNQKRARQSSEECTTNTRITKQTRLFVSTKSSLFYLYG